MERAAIVDPHHHLPAAAYMGDTGIARYRQDGMRRGHRVHVVGLAARGLLSVEFLAVPAGDAALVKRPHRGERHILLAEDFIRPVGRAMQRLDARLGVGHTGAVPGWIRLGAVVLVVAALPPR